MLAVVLATWCRGQIWVISWCKLHLRCLFVEISCVCSPGGLPGLSTQVKTDPEAQTGSAVCIKAGCGAQLGSGLCLQRKRTWFGRHGTECAVNWPADWGGLPFIGRGCEFDLWEWGLGSDEGSALVSWLVSLLSRCCVCSLNSLQ